MSKETLKNLIGIIDDNNAQSIYNVLPFIPVSTPLPDEIEAITIANKDIAENGTVSMEAIDWN